MSLVVGDVVAAFIEETRDECKSFSQLPFAFVHSQLRGMDDISC